MVCCGGTNDLGNGVRSVLAYLYPPKPARSCSQIQLTVDLINSGSKVSVDVDAIVLYISTVSFRLHRNFMGFGELASADRSA